MTRPLVALSSPVSDWMVSAPVDETDVVPVPPTAKVFAERFVVEAPPENVVSPLKVSAEEVALPTNGYANESLLLKVFQSVDDREPVAEVPAKPIDNCWPVKDRPLAGEPKVTSPVLVPEMELPLTVREVIVVVAKVEVPVTAKVPLKDGLLVTLMVPDEVVVETVILVPAKML